MCGYAGWCGIPRRNCNVGKCCGIRQGQIQATARTQSSIAGSTDDKNWVIFNTSPDIRAQLEACPALHPQQGLRDTGIKAINTCLTIGQGQRIGLIAGSGVGKSVLLGMLTRNTEADVVIIGLIGERGREVQEFIHQILGEKGLAKSVVVAAPANVSPVLRLKATNLTHLIAEYFRDRGQNVLMLCDSLTRVAHAQREIGLAIGEPPTAKGYPPSVFALLPRLIERAGVGRNGHGSSTAGYTVLALSLIHT